MIDLDAIKARTDCRTVADEYGVDIKNRQGDWWRARCWHSDRHNNGDRTPSMTVGAGGFKCHGCGASGSVLDMVMSFEGLDLQEAAAILAEQYGIEDTPGRRPRRARRPRARVATPQTPQTKPASVQAVDPIRADLWGRIWAALVFSDQPDGPKRWAAERGISWQAVTLASVRDATHAAGEIIEILREYTRAEHLAAGTMRADGKPWHPLRVVAEIAAGDRAHADGAFIPIWSPTYGALPVGFRYRLYEPWGNGAKTLAQFSGAPVLPLGLDRLDMMAKLGTPYTVILCEGETDWLAAQDAMRTLGRPCACLAHCMMSKPWAASWTRLIADASLAERVWILFDGDASAGRDRARDIAQQTIAERGAGWAAERVTIHLTDAAGDLADLHKKGDLAGLLNDLLDRQTITLNEAMGA